MRGMKDSGIEWIGEIPEDWGVAKVKNIFNRKNEKAKLENPIVLSLARSGVRVRDISNNEGQLAESYYNYNPVSKGDLLLNPMDLYSGANCSISNVEGVISPAYVNLRAKNNIVARYYDYFFKTQYWSMALFAHGKGVSFDNRWTLNVETLMNYNLPFTSLEEQELIADYLDEKIQEIDNIILKTHKTIEEYKKYKQSVITEAVTKGLNPNVEMKDSGIEWIGEIPKDWKITPLKYLVGLNEESLKENTDNEYEFNYIDIGSVTLEDGIKEYQKMNFGDSPSRARRKVKYKDVIVSTVRTYLKAIATIPNKEDIIASTGFAVLTPYNINHKYLSYFTKSNYFAEIVSAYSTGISYPAINSSQIINFKIVFGDENEQKEIANYLDKKCIEIDSLITKKQELITQLEIYKKSLIYECVTGKKEVALSYAY